MNDTKTFKNISDSVFQDGDLVVKPGESFATDNPGRIEQLTGQYAWQFAEVSGKEAKDAPSEAEVKAAPTDVREVRAADHVALNAEGDQAEKIGS